MKVLEFLKLNSFGTKIRSILLKSRTDLELAPEVNNVKMHKETTLHGLISNQELNHQSGPKLMVIVTDY